MGKNLHWNSFLILHFMKQLRKTKTVAMLPVGLVSGSPVSTPIVENGQYAGFYVGWDGKRKFPLDMAGFAFSVRYYREVYYGKLSLVYLQKYNFFIYFIQLSQEKTIAMPYVRGYEEDGFLKQLDITRQTLEILSEDKVKKFDNYSRFKLQQI